MAIAPLRSALDPPTEVRSLPLSHNRSLHTLLRPPVVLTVLTLAAAVLRLFHLGSKSLWMDEAASVALARMPWHQYAWVWWWQEGNMTAYYLLLRPWLHLGQSETWIRLLSVIFGIAAIPAIYFLARRLTDSSNALVATALLAVNPAHIYYSQEARSYSLTIFLVLLSSFFFVRAVEERHGRDWVLWAAFGVLSVYAHYFAALVLAAEAVSLLLLRPAKVQWLRFYFCTALIAVLALPGISFVLLRGNKLNLPWIPSPSLKEVIHLWMFLGGSGPKFVICVVLWIAGLFAVVRTWRSQGRAEESWREGLLVVWAVLPMIITIVASLHQSVFSQKYLLVCLPATVMLAALGARTLQVKYLGAALVVLLCVFSIGTDIRAADKPREDWRSASRAILTNAQPGDAIIFYPFYSRVAFEYYVGRYGTSAPPLHAYSPEFYGTTGENEQHLRQALASGKPNIQRVWVVLLGPDAQASDLPSRDPATAAALASHFRMPTTQQFKDLAVVEFQR